MLPRGPASLGKAWASEVSSFHLRAKIPAATHVSPCVPQMSLLHFLSACRVGLEDGKVLPSLLSRGCPGPFKPAQQNHHQRRGGRELCSKHLSLVVPERGDHHQGAGSPSVQRGPDSLQTAFIPVHPPWQGVEALQGLW